MNREKYTRIVDNKMRGFGQTDLGKKIIRVNKKRAKKEGNRGELLDTIVHEENHRKHPKMYERTVRKKTEKQILKMRRSERQDYYAKFR